MENRLRVLRAERDWSQQDLAERLEVSRQSVNAIETGKYDPSLPLAFRIAELFELPIEEISSRPRGEARRRSRPFDAPSASSMIASALQEQLGVDDHARGGGILAHLLGPRCADDRRGDVGLAQHPGERELRQGQPGLFGDRLQPLHGAQHVAAASAGP